MRVVTDDDEIVKYNLLLVWQGVCDILHEKMSYIGQTDTHMYAHRHTDMAMYEKME